MSVMLYLEKYTCNVMSEKSYVIYDIIDGIIDAIISSYVSVWDALSYALPSLRRIWMIYQKI